MSARPATLPVLTSLVYLKAISNAIYELTAPNCYEAISAQGGEVKCGFHPPTIERLHTLADLAEWIADLVVETQIECGDPEPPPRRTPPTTMAGATPCAQPYRSNPRD